MDRNSSSIRSAVLERCTRLFEDDRFLDVIAESSAALLDEPENIELLELRSSAYGLEGELEKSLEDVEKIIAIIPDAPKGYLFRAETRLEVDEMAEVLDDLNKAIELDPDSQDAYILMSAYWFAHFDLDKIEAATAAALRLGPENAAALDFRAACLAWRGRHLESQELYQKSHSEMEKLLENGPRNHNSLSFYAVSLSHRMEDEQALAIMEEGIRRFPKSPYFLIHRANHHMQWGRFDRAEADLDAAKTILERFGLRDSGYIIARSDLLAQRDESKVALEQLRSLLEWMPNNPTAMLRCQSLIRNIATNDEEDIEYALETADRLCEMLPDCSQAFIFRYWLLCKEGKRDETGNDLEHAMRTLPPNTADRSWAALYLIECGDLDMVMDLLNRVIEEEPENCYAIGLRGIVWNALGAYDRAVHEFDFVLKKDGKDVRILEERGLAWLELGRFGFTTRLFRRAIDDFSRGLEIEPKNHMLWRLRGQGWYRLALRSWFGKKPAFENAISDYSEAIRLNPDDAVVWQYRALVHWKRSEFEAAIENCTEAIRLEPYYLDALRLRALAFRRLKKPEEAKRDELEIERILDSQ